MRFWNSIFGNSESKNHNNQNDSAKNKRKGLLSGKSQKSQASKTRQLLLEQFENRELLSINGPQLNSVFINQDESQLLGNESGMKSTLNIAPTSFLLRFSEGQTIDPTTLGGIQVYRAGDNKTYDTLVDFGYIGIGDNPNEVIVRFADNLPDDLYQIRLVGGDDNAASLKNTLGEAFYYPDGGTDPDHQTVPFTLQLGAKVTSVVTQPTSRDTAGNLQQSRNTIEIYFTDEELKLANTPNDRKLFQLIVTKNTLDPTDDLVIIPTDLKYEPNAMLDGQKVNRVTLTFSKDASGKTITDLADLGTGSFRLRLGERYIQTATSNLDLSSDESQLLVGDTFHTAFQIPTPKFDTKATNGDGDDVPQSLIVQGKINTSYDPVEYPGAIDNPGHRDLSAYLGNETENHYISGEAYMGVKRDMYDGPTTIYYNFQYNLPVFPGTNPGYVNNITEAQKALTRKALDLFSRYYGIEFVETADKGITISTGNFAWLGGRSNSGYDVVTRYDASLLSDDYDPATFGSYTMLEENQNWGPMVYGGKWFGAVVQGISMAIGIGYSNDLMPGTDMRFGYSATGGDYAAAPDGNGYTMIYEKVFPGWEDRIHGQYLFRPDSNDIDLYQFKIEKNGLFSAEILAERANDASPLNAVIRLYAEVRKTLPDGGTILTYELLSQNDDYFSGDSFLEMYLESAGEYYTGNYYIGVSASGNDEYNPQMSGTGEGGLTEGAYELRLNFSSNGIDRNNETTFTDSTGKYLVDTTNVKLDGDNDMVPGGAYNFWFNVQQKNETALSNLYLFLSKPGTTSDQIQKAIAEINKYDKPNALKSSLENINRTLYVDNSSRDYNKDGSAMVIDPNKLREPSVVGNGTITNPFKTIEVALEFATTLQLLLENAGIKDSSVIVRIVGNNFQGDDYDTSKAGNKTLTDNKAYEIGKMPNTGASLTDGTKFDIPKGVSVVIDAGVVIKMNGANITVGSSDQNIDRSGGSIQLLGNPRHKVLITSYADETVGRDTNPLQTKPDGGNWGGIVIRNDLDYEFINKYTASNSAKPREVLEKQGIFLNYINNADLRYGGGALSATDKLNYDPIHVVDARPTITFNTITYSANAAISASPRSFEETRFQNWDHTTPYTLDYTRIGLHVHGNTVVRNAINGLLVQVRTPVGQQIQKIDVAARFDDLDIVHVLSENLTLAGAPGGNTLVSATTEGLWYDQSTQRLSVEFDIRLDQRFEVDHPVLNSSNPMRPTDRDYFSLSDGETKVTFEYNIVDFESDKVSNIRRVATGHVAIDILSNDTPEEIARKTAAAINAVNANKEVWVNAAGVANPDPDAGKTANYPYARYLIGNPSDPTITPTQKLTPNQFKITATYTAGSNGMILKSTGIGLKTDGIQAATPDPAATATGLAYDPVARKINFDFQDTTDPVKPASGNYSFAPIRPVEGDYFSISDYSNIYGETKVFFEYNYIDYYKQDVTNQGRVAANRVAIDILTTDTAEQIAQKTADAINAVRTKIEVYETVNGKQYPRYLVGDLGLARNQFRITASLDTTTATFSSTVGREVLTGVLLQTAKDIDPSDTETATDLAVSGIQRVQPGNLPGMLKSRTNGTLNISPGIIVKSNNARIELEMGTQLLAEGTVEQPIIFTSLYDTRYGVGGIYKTASKGDGSAVGTVQPGNWAGIFQLPDSNLSIDHAVIAYAGGSSPIDGVTAKFNPIEIHEADARIANSRFENNMGSYAGDRTGRGATSPSVIYVLGSQPIILHNTFIDNTNNITDSASSLAVISINANSLTDEVVIDKGRSSGALDRNPAYDGNYGPLVRENRYTNNSINGMIVRGEVLTTASTWDDTDIAHVLFSEIIVPNFHSTGGLKLTSDAGNSLIVKLFGQNAGFTTSGTPLETDERIGGAMQVVGVPGYPVVFTSLRDDTVGAGFDLAGKVMYDTNNTYKYDSESKKWKETAPSAAPGDWRSIKFANYSNDRNVLVIKEYEKAGDLLDSNGTPATAQDLGYLAPDMKSGDDVRRLGFEVNGSIRSGGTDPTTFQLQPAEADVYKIHADSGTEMWIDIDWTGRSLDTIIEILDKDGNILASSDSSFYEGPDAYGRYINRVFDARGEEYDHGNTTSFARENNAFPMNKSMWARAQTGVSGAGRYTDADGLMWYYYNTADGIGYNDLYSTNVRDAGLRYVAEGPGDKDYYIRIRSVLSISWANSLTRASHGKTFYIQDADTKEKVTYELDFDSADSRISNTPNYIYIGLGSLKAGESYATRIAAAITELTANTNKSVSVAAKVTKTSLGDTNPTIVLDGVNLIFNPCESGLVLQENSSGAYQLQVRLQETDEIPGCSVAYADIRYGLQGIEVYGFPQHSPIMGEVQNRPNLDLPGGMGKGTYLGNLVQSDLGTISVGGYLSSLSDVDWYVFSMDPTGMQSHSGSTPNTFLWPAIFDIDYTDGLTRPDLSLWVFDSLGRLIYMGGDSNIADDRPGPNTDINIQKLGAGSVGSSDPFIGPALLGPTLGAEGSGLVDASGEPITLPDGSSVERAYFVAVTSKYAVPAILSTFLTKDFTANAATRVEPIDSIYRIAEEHVNGGQNTGNSDIDEGQQRLTLTPDEYHLGDVVCYISVEYPTTGRPGDPEGTSKVYMINPFTGEIILGGNTNKIHQTGYDMSMAPDGRLLASYNILDQFHVYAVDQSKYSNTFAYGGRVDGTMVDSELYPCWYKDGELVIEEVEDTITGFQLNALTSNPYLWLDIRSQSEESHDYAVENLSAYPFIGYSVAIGNMPWGDYPRYGYSVYPSNANVMYLLDPSGYAIDAMFSSRNEPKPVSGVVPFAIFYNGVDGPVDWDGNQLFANEFQNVGEIITGTTFSADGKRLFAGTNFGAIYEIKNWASRRYGHYYEPPGDGPEQKIYSTGGGATLDFLGYVFDDEGNILPISGLEMGPETVEGGIYKDLLFVTSQKTSYYSGDNVLFNSSASFSNTGDSKLVAVDPSKLDSGLVANIQRSGNNFVSGKIVSSWNITLPTSQNAVGHADLTVSQAFRNLENLIFQITSNGGTVNTINISTSTPVPNPNYNPYRPADPVYNAEYLSIPIAKTTDPSKPINPYTNFPYELLFSAKYNPNYSTEFPTDHFTNSLYIYAAAPNPRYNPAVAEHEVTNPRYLLQPTANPTYDPNQPDNEATNWPYLFANVPNPYFNPSAVEGPGNPRYLPNPQPNPGFDSSQPEDVYYNPKYYYAPLVNENYKNDEPADPTTNWPYFVTPSKNPDYNPSLPDNTQTNWPYLFTPDLNPYYNSGLPENYIYDRENPGTYNPKYITLPSSEPVLTWASDQQLAERIVAQARGFGLTTTAVKTGSHWRVVFEGVAEIGNETPRSTLDIQEPWEKANNPLAPIFVNGQKVLTLLKNDGLPADTAHNSVVSITFSKMDYNLWHRTGTDADLVGPTASRVRSITGFDTPPEQEDSMTHNGAGTSWYFGLEPDKSPNRNPYDDESTPNANLLTDDYFAWGATASGYTPAVLNAVEPRNLTGTDVNIGSYDMPGGTYGALTSSTFSLADYSAGDRPMLYYSYRFDAEGTQDFLNYGDDALMVYVSADGKNWKRISASNYDLFSDPSNNWEMTQPDNFVTLIQDNRWRQERIDLSEFAGQTNVRIKFVFSTAGGQIGLGKVNQAGTLLTSVSASQLFDSRNGVTQLPDGHYDHFPTQGNVTASTLSPNSSTSYFDYFNSSSAFVVRDGAKKIDGTSDNTRLNTYYTTAADALDSSVVYRYSQGYSLYVPIATGGQGQATLTDWIQVNDERIYFGDLVGNSTDSDEVKLLKLRLLNSEEFMNLLINAVNERVDGATAKRYTLHGGNASVSNPYYGQQIYFEGVTLLKTSQPTKYIVTGDSQDTTLDEIAAMSNDQLLAWLNANSQIGSNAIENAARYNNAVPVPIRGDMTAEQVAGSVAFMVNLTMNEDLKNYLRLNPNATIGSAWTSLDTYYNLDGNLVNLATDARGSYDPRELVELFKVESQTLERTMRLDVLRNSLNDDVKSASFTPSSMGSGTTAQMTLVGKAVVSYTQNGKTKSGGMAVQTTELQGANQSDRYNVVKDYSKATLYGVDPDGTVRRATDNAHGGVMIDNIIIGAAERGEMVSYVSYDNSTGAGTVKVETGAGAMMAGFLTLADAKLNGNSVIPVGQEAFTPYVTNRVPETTVQFGAYQLEIRRGAETVDYYPSWTNPTASYANLISTIHTNERMTDGITLVTPLASEIYHGQKFSLSDGVNKIDFCFLADHLPQAATGSAEKILFNQSDSVYAIASKIVAAINKAYAEKKFKVSASLFTNGTLIDLFDATDFKNGGLEAIPLDASGNSVALDSEEYNDWFLRNGEGGKPIKHIIYGPVHETRSSFDYNGKTDAYESYYAYLDPLTGNVVPIREEQYSGGSVLARFIDRSLDWNDPNYAHSAFGSDLANVSRLYIDTWNGSLRRGDTNTVREKGQLNIIGSSFMAIDGFGIYMLPVELTLEDTAPGKFFNQMAQPGGVINGNEPVIDAEGNARLGGSWVPGVAIINNIFAYNGLGQFNNELGGGIALLGLEGYVPFVRIVNNTFFGYAEERSGQIVNQQLGIGIAVGQNTTPTIMNNIFSNLMAGIMLFEIEDGDINTIGNWNSTMEPVVALANVFKNNGINQPTGIGDVEFDKYLSAKNWSLSFPSDLKAALPNGKPLILQVNGTTLTVETTQTVDEVTSTVDAATLAERVIAALNEADVPGTVSAQPKLNNGVVVGLTFYGALLVQCDNTNFATAPSAEDPLFVNPSIQKRNFYLVENSPAIDAGRESLKERESWYNRYVQNYGIPESTIYAPTTDFYGQIRKSDTETDHSGGGGSHPFVDIGAIDRVDKVKPTASLLKPIDNDTNDRNPVDYDIFLVNAVLDQFIVQLNDLGIGIDDMTVADDRGNVYENVVTILEQGWDNVNQAFYVRKLVLGTDYFANYNAANDQIYLVPTKGRWNSNATYTIILDNDAMPQWELNFPSDLEAAFPNHEQLTIWIGGTALSVETTQMIDGVTSTVDADTLAQRVIDALAEANIPGTGSGVVSAEPKIVDGAVVGLTFAEAQFVQCDNFDFDITSTIGETSTTRNGIADRAGNSLEWNRANGQTYFTVVLGGYDYGDAPASYPTLNDNNPARHIVWNGFCLGKGVTVEPNGQPSNHLLDSNGKQTHGDQYDDGVSALDGGELVLTPGKTIEFTINVSAKNENFKPDADGYVGFVNAFFDWDDSGSWNDNGNDERMVWIDETGAERTDPLPVKPGANTVKIVVPSTYRENGTTKLLEEGEVFARFRLSSKAEEVNEKGEKIGTLGPGGLAADGEVEDYKFVLALHPRSYGDAPKGTFVNPYTEKNKTYTYPVSKAEGGAWHATDIKYGIDASGKAVRYDASVDPTTEKFRDQGGAVHFGVLAPLQRLDASYNATATANATDDGIDLNKGYGSLMFVDGETAHVEMTVTVPDALKAYMQANPSARIHIAGWFDLKGTGTWDANSISATQTLSLSDLSNAKLVPGTTDQYYVTVDVKIPKGTITAKGISFARFRIATSDNGISPIPGPGGPSETDTPKAIDGEVEDYMIYMMPYRTNYSDAEDPSTPLEDRAVHRIPVDDNGNPIYYYLGDKVNTGFDPRFPEVVSSSENDNDGVTIPTMNINGVDYAAFMATGTTTIIVNASTAGRLSFWIDTNGDGVYQEDERITDPKTGNPWFEVKAGPNEIPVTLDHPEIFGMLETGARFRFTDPTVDHNNLRATGETKNGEVEDYVVYVIGGHASISGTVYNDANGDGQHGWDEVGIGGATVYLLDQNMKTIDTKTTDVYGEYVFDGLYPSVYYVRMEPLAKPWVMTNPANGTSGKIQLGENQEYNYVDFGNFKPGTVSIGDAIISEGNSGYKTVEIPVYLTGSFGAATQITVKTSDGTAISGQDYLGGTATYTFDPQSTPSTTWNISTVSSGLGTDSGQYDSSVSGNTLAYASKIGSTWQIMIESLDDPSGVFTLTNSTRDSIAPQVLQVGDSVYVVWSSYNGTNYEVYYSYGSSKDLSSLRQNIHRLNAGTIGNNSDNLTPQISVDSSGKVFVAWCVKDATGNSSIVCLEPSEYNLDNNAIALPIKYNGDAYSGKVSRMLLDGQTVAWSTSGSEIYVSSIQNGNRQTVLASNGGTNQNLRIKNGIAAWEYQTGSGSSMIREIAVYNVQYGKLLFLAQDDAYLTAPDVNDKWVVWQSETRLASGNRSRYEIYSLNLESVFGAPDSDKWSSYRNGTGFLDAYTPEYAEFNSTGLTTVQVNTREDLNNLLFSDPSASLSVQFVDETLFREFMQKKSLTETSYSWIMAVPPTEFLPAALPNKENLDIVINGVTVSVPTVKEVPNPDYDPDAEVDPNAEPVSETIMTWLTDEELVDAIVKAVTDAKIAGELEETLVTAEVKTEGTRFGVEFKNAKTAVPQNSAFSVITYMSIPTTGDLSRVFPQKEDLKITVNGTVVTVPTVKVDPNDPEATVWLSDTELADTIIAAVNALKIPGGLNSSVTAKRYTDSLGYVYVDFSNVTSVVPDHAALSVASDQEETEVPETENYGKNVKEAILLTDLTKSVSIAHANLESLVFAGAVNAPITIAAGATPALQFVQFNEDINATVTANLPAAKSLFFGGDVNAAVNITSPTLKDVGFFGTVAAEMNFRGSTLHSLINLGTIRAPITANCQTFVNYGTVYDGSVFAGTGVQSIIVFDMIDYTMIAKLPEVVNRPELQMFLTDVVKPSLVSYSSYYADNVAPRLNGNQVVWRGSETLRSDYWYAYHADLANPMTSTSIVSGNGYSAWAPILSESRVVWRAQVGTNYSIFTATANAPVVKGTVKFQIIGDTMVEDDEYFYVEIVGASIIGESTIPVDPSDIIGEKSKGIVWILNDDGPLDYGDLPATYSTLVKDDGARHMVNMYDPLALFDPRRNPNTSVNVDTENDGIPSSGADGDDLNTIIGRNDEQGVFFGYYNEETKKWVESPWVPGQKVTMQVYVTKDCYLNAFADWNQNGVFGKRNLAQGTVAYDSQERLENLFDDKTRLDSQGYKLTEGLNTVTFTVPRTAKSGTTYARFRVSSAGGLSFFGQAADGEVEDYKVNVAQGSTSSSPVSLDKATGTLTITGSVLRDEIVIRRLDQNTNRLNKLSVMYNGTYYTYNPEDVKTINYDGIYGSDIVTVYGLASDAEHVTMRPFNTDSSKEGTVIVGTGLTINLKNAPNVVFDGGAAVSGQTKALDSADLYDSSDSDRLTMRPNQTTMSGYSYSNTILNVQNVFAYSENGGYDEVWMYGMGAANNTLTMTPGSATFSNTGYQAKAEGFRSIHAYNVAGSKNNVMTFDGTKVSNIDLTFTRSTNPLSNILAGTYGSISRPTSIELIGFDQQTVRGDVGSQINVFGTIQSEKLLGRKGSDGLFNSPPQTVDSLRFSQINPTSDDDYMLELLAFEHVTARSVGSTPNKKDVATDLAIQLANGLLFEGEWM